MKPVVTLLAMLCLLASGVAADPVDSLPDPAVSAAAQPVPLADVWASIPIPEEPELTAIREALDIEFDPEDMEYTVTVKDSQHSLLFLRSYMNWLDLRIGFNTSGTEPLGVNRIVLANATNSLPIDLPPTLVRQHPWLDMNTNTRYVAEDFSLVIPLTGEVLQPTDVPLGPLWELVNSETLTIAYFGPDNVRMVQVPAGVLKPEANLLRFIAGLRAKAYELDPGNVIQDETWAEYEEYMG